MEKVLSRDSKTTLAFSIFALEKLLKVMVSFFALYVMELMGKSGCPRSLAVVWKPDLPSMPYLLITKSQVTYLEFLE